jgi:protein phosphatase
MLQIDKRHDHGPFDIIGDVHGCVDELQALLTKLGCRITWRVDDGGRTVAIKPPPGRKIVFVGDIVDRGPNAPDILRIAMSMAASGAAYVVKGNNERKLEWWLSGRHMAPGHGLQITIDQLNGDDPGFLAAVPRFLEGLPSYVWLDGGRLAVAHAGLKEHMIGRISDDVREYALRGGGDWPACYHGAVAVVHGHTPVRDAAWVNNTLDIDTGCVFGRKLTALRWPENELVDVPAVRVWFAPKRTDLLTVP